MFIDVLLVAGGIALLTIGGEALVRGSLRLTKPLGISPLLAGLVIVGFGTSSPELAVSLGAAIAGKSDIAVGNIVGSNIANILLVLGLSAVIAPLAVTRLAFRRDALSMVAATVLFLLVAATETIGRVAAVVFLLAMGGYIAWAYRSERSEATVTSAQDPSEVVHPPSTLWVAVILVVVGLGLLVGGARLLITGAVPLAVALGVSEAVVGLTVVAVGTSLPELAVSLVAVLRGKVDLAIGNVLGSNIFNALAILGVSALAAPLAVNPRILVFDQWVMLGAAVVLTFFLYTGMRLARWEGGILLAGYVVYVTLTFTHFAT